MKWYRVLLVSEKRLPKKVGPSMVWYLPNARVSAIKTLQEWLQWHFDGKEDQKLEMLKIRRRGGGLY